MKQKNGAKAGYDEVLLELWVEDGDPDDIHAFILESRDELTIEQMRTLLSQCARPATIRVVEDDED